VAALVVACTPTPPDTSTTTTTTTSTTPGQVAPTISSFTATPGAAAAPALVALGWSVSDPQNDTLTCRLDIDADGSAEVTLPGCQATGSRNVTYPAAGSFTARLSVTDGTNTTTAERPVTISAGVSETFDIELQFVSSVSPEQADAFGAAEARWESVILRGIPAANVNIAAGTCLEGAPAVNRSVDDLIIQARVAPIDGPGRVLASAGPCLIGTADGIPRLGIMNFDVDDLGGLTSNGTLDDVVLHEMGHVLGIGTRWSAIGPVLSGAGGADPRYIGARGVAAWSAFGRNGTVPVEADGGAGTRDSHWDEVVFGNELMTGFVSNVANPMSRLTISSLADLGYQVDPDQADPYTVPGAAARAQGDDGHDLAGREVLITPIGTV
jgi:hypothetical protein